MSQYERSNDVVMQPPDPERRVGIDPIDRGTMAVRAAQAAAYGQAPEAKDWRRRANCIGLDPDIFFPEKTEDTLEAKQICGDCDVREQCLDYALANGEKHGIWGGKSEKDRKTIAKFRVLNR